MNLFNQTQAKVCERTVKILVVDDEANIGELIKKALKKSCFTVDIITEPHLVKEMLNRKKYHLLILDIRMPQISGISLYNQLVTENPRIAHKTMFITGDTYSQETLNFLKKATNPFLTKPFEINEFINTVNSLIEQT